MNARGTAGRLAVGLASLALVAGCASGASPTPVPATPTPIVTPSAAVATPTAGPDADRVGCRADDLRAGHRGHRRRDHAPA